MSKPATAPRHQKRQGATLESATHCNDCGCKLPVRRRVLMQGVGVICVPCHAKRWGQ